MPRALAVETSGRNGSIASVDAGAVREELEFPHGLRHAAEILPLIDRLCRNRGWSPADVQHLYVSAGPGSFTGLRIAVTLAKTMAFATGVKLVAVPSVRVLAHNAPPDARHVVIVLDAKRDQIFTARFERAADADDDPDAAWVEREPARLDALSAVLARAPRPVHLLGEGIPYHLQFIPPTDPAVIVTPEPLWRARASVVAAIGGTMAATGQFADPDRLTPIYIRPPEAEEKFDKARAAAVVAAPT